MGKKIIGEDGKEYKVKKPFYKKLWFKIIVGLIVLGAIGNAIGGNDSNTAKKEPNAISETQNVKEETKEEPKEEPKEEIIEVSAGDLLKAYDDNEVKADKTYKGKAANVKGIIKDVGVSLGQTFITIGTGDDMEFLSVQAFFKDEAEIDKVSELVKGNEVTVQGKITGKSLNIGMDNCKIVD